MRQQIMYFTTKCILSFQQKNTRAKYVTENKTNWKYPFFPFQLAIYDVKNTKINEYSGITPLNT
jgi:hypothetical protein